MTEILKNEYLKNIDENQLLDLFKELIENRVKIEIDKKIAEEKERKKEEMRIRKNLWNIEYQKTSEKNKQYRRERYLKLKAVKMEN